MSNRVNKVTKSAIDQRIIDALGSQLKATTTLTLDGKVYKVKVLQQQLQAEVDAAKATQSAKTAYAQAVLAEEEVVAQANWIRINLRAALIAGYGAKIAIVAEFGFIPKKAAVDVATKSDANAKRAATVAAKGAKEEPSSATVTGNAPKAATAS